MPINHSVTANASANPASAQLSTTAWNAAHTVPTLTEVLAAGHDGSSVILSNLPSTDPHVVGQLYTNAGVLMVSAG